MSDKVQNRQQRCVVTALQPTDEGLIEGLTVGGFRVVQAVPETLDGTVKGEAAVAVVADIDLAGVLAAVSRLRKSQGPGVKVVLLGGAQATFSATGQHPAVQVGANAFFARPMTAAELMMQVEALLDTAGAAMPNTVNQRPGSRTPTNFRPQGPMAVPPSSRPSSGGRISSSPAPDAALQVHPSVSPSSIPPTMTTVGGGEWAAVGTWLSVGRAPEASSAEVGSSVETARRTALVTAELASEVKSADFELPPLGDDPIEDLVPIELLEPLESGVGGLGAELGVETTSSGALSSTTTNPGIPSARRGARGVGTTGGAGLSPLLLDGELRLAGAVGRFGVARLFAAGALGRSTGVLALRTPRGEWRVAIDGGHVLSARSDRAEDQIGPLFSRLGFIPREAARFANVSLDTGARGAALLAARGYLASDALTITLGRAAEELLFDLVCLPSADWELRPLESSESIPLPHRSLDTVLLQACRARIEPAVAFGALGGDGTALTLRAESTALAGLGLTSAESAAVTAARRVALATLLRMHGENVLPAFVALYWLHWLSAEGPAHDLDAVALPPGVERVRLRALTEAAHRKDYLVLLGVSAWATRGAAELALGARRAELDAMRARVSGGEGLQAVYMALDEAARLLADVESWERYVGAVRER